MNTLQIEIKLMQHFIGSTDLIIPNVHGGLVRLHECDILMLSKARYATEIEIKISKSDLLIDQYKQHKHISNYIARFYFAVPSNLVPIALKNIPKRAGLYEMRKKGVPYLIKQCQRTKGCLKWTLEQRNYLAYLGSMRILSLKKKILDLKSYNQIRF